MEIDAEDIRRLLLFEYEFDEAKSLEEIKERLKRTFRFFPAVDLVEVLGEVCGKLKVEYRFPLPKDLVEDAIAMKSSAVDPPMVYFLLLKDSKRGGKIILFETVNSWYTHEKILSSMRAYCKNAGIRCKLIPYEKG